MASKVRFKANKAGFREILNGSGAQSLCLAKARAIEAAANSMTDGGWTADVRPGRNRCHAVVKPTHDNAGNRAAAENRRRNVLLRARGW